MGAAPFDRARRALRGTDVASAAEARRRHDGLAKPPGSLGRLEELGAWLAAVSGRCPPPVPRRPAVAVFAGDHGVVASGVTPWPQSVTASMVATMTAGGAAVAVLADRIGASLVVVDVGLATPSPAHPSLLERNVVRGTADLATGPALTRAQVSDALDVGADVAGRLVAEGADLLVTGEMGIGNTTPAAAVIAALTGEPAAACTGRGTGIDDSTLAHKTTLVAAAVDRLPPGASAERVLGEVGGAEVVALAGFVVGGAAAGVPVVVDGVITLAALLAAERLAPGVRDRCVAGHRSSEPGASVALRHLGMEPVLDLGLRLGEGTGACLAVPVVQAAAAVLGGMATLEDAVAEPSPWDGA